MHQTSIIARLQNAATFSLQATQGPIDYFVRDLDGDDSNDGLSQTKAFKTFAPLDRIPYQIDHLTIAHVGDHQGTGYAMPLLGSHLYNHRLHIFGDGAGTGDGFTETLVEEASIAGTDETKVVPTTTSHALDQFKGHTVIFTSGVCIGYRREVRSNTAGGPLLFVTDTDQLGLIPSPGDTFRVVRPSVVINMSEGVASNLVYSVASGESVGFSSGSSDPGISGGLVFSQIRINATQPQTLAFNNLHIAFYGVESDQDGGVRVDWQFGNCACFHGNNVTTGFIASVGVDLGAPDDAAWVGYGVYRVDTGSRANGGPFTTDGQTSVFHSFIVSNKALELRGNVLIFGGNIPGLDIRAVSHPTRVQLIANAFTSNPIKVFVTGTEKALVIFESVLSMFKVDFDSVDGNMIVVKRGAFVRDAGSCTGQSTTALSVLAAGGGRYYMDTASLIGDAVALDFSVDGAAPDVNKSFFTGKAVGIGNAVTSSSISRERD